MKTMTRRSLSIVLAVMMVVSSMLTCAITANAATDWYLVGSSTSIFGASWSPAQAANKMDYANGVWTKTYNIKKTEHVSYKISDANGWNGQQVPNNGGNQEVDVTAGDVLTFTFDGSTLTATGAHATPVETQYYLVGDAPFFAGSWDPANAADKMDKQADGSFVKTYTNVAKTGNLFEYKVTGAGGWGDSEIPSKGNQNYTVQNDGATLTFVVKDGVLSVTEAVPETQAPTTEAPTTEAPSEEPTTEAPTTEAPTTQASVLEDGFYLAGVKGWTAADLVGYKFSANPAAEGEYMLDTTLTKGDSIKVVKVESDAITAYYPALGDNYVVTDETAGDVTIYFKEAYSDEWKDFGGHIWIAVQAEPEEDYEVTYTYNYDGEDVTVTKTIKAKASEIEAKIEANVPAINNQINTYSFDGAVKGEGNKYTAALKAVAKEYTVSINGNDLEGTYKYMDKATVNSDTDVAFVVDGQVVAYGKSYTFYVIGDTDVTTDATKTLADFASISKTAEIAADGKVTVELLASAVVEKFERMGIAFASSEKTADQIKDDVLAITAGTAKGTNVAVHNSSVTEANESGQYQFVYAPYITNGYNGKLYFYTFAVNSDNEVIVSAASEVDYATITK